MTSSHPESEVIRIPVLPTLHGGDSSIQTKSDFMITNFPIIKIKPLRLSTGLK